ncbi:MAG: gamma-glutamyl-gamma-aminobutyrate hydrolase family protein [Anaerolineaceae bacterium]|nr:gamma-glutamyl-gamma-aminobutyrate hydrolase family protein [Anaerolineaceae bacterium]
MPSPLIGITTRTLSDHEGLAMIAAVEAYVHSVIRAGGLPVLIPLGIPSEQLDKLRRRLDGVLFTGGADIDPVLFGGEPHPSVYGVNPERDRLELELLRQVAERGTPFLGICRGFQVANVALGGSLYTHLPDQYPGGLKHDHPVSDSCSRLAHHVQIEAGTCLARIVAPDDLPVNSLHHQGARDIAPGLVVNARAEDGLVEGLELPGHPFGLAVQWHPEWLPDVARMQAIFRAFVEAAAQAAA